MMNRDILLYFGTVFILSGCGIGGFWMNGNPFPSKLGPPPIEYWVNSSASIEQRRLDSIECGGGILGPGFSVEQLEAEQQPGEYLLGKPNARLWERWELCMMKKSYSYIGECLDTEISKKRPSCRDL